MLIIVQESFIGLLERKKLFLKRKEIVARKNLVCYKCGKVGHMRNECKLKDMINNLNQDEGLKQ